MESRRVVITGLGTVNAVARTAPAFAAALQAGRCGIGPITVFDTTGFPTRTGGEIRDFSPHETIPEALYGKRMSRSDVMAMAAALEALQDAGLLPLSGDLQEETGVAVGGGAGGMLEGEAVFPPVSEGPCRGGTVLRLFRLLLCFVRRSYGFQTEPGGAQNHFHDGLLLRGHGTGLCPGSDPGRAGPGDDCGGHRTSGAYHLCRLQCVEGGGSAPLQTL